MGAPGIPELDSLHLRHLRRQQPNLEQPAAMMAITEDCTSGSNGQQRWTSAIIRAAQHHSAGQNISVLCTLGPKGSQIRCK